MVLADMANRWNFGRALSGRGVEHFSFESWLDKLLGPRSGHSVQYPTRFRLYALVVFVAIVLWLAAYVTYVLPVMKKEMRLGRSPGAGNQLMIPSIEAHVFSLAWFTVTRVIHFLPCVADRSARLYAQPQAGLRAFGMKLFFLDGPVLLFVGLTSMLFWVVFMYVSDRTHNGTLVTVLMVLQIHSSAVSALAMFLALWHNRLMIGDPVPELVQARGRSQDIVGRFESCLYDERTFGDEEGRLYPAECTICLGVWEASDVIKVTPCQHAFHEECLVSWLAKASTCALCRRDLCRSAQECHSSIVAAPTLAV